MAEWFYPCAFNAWDVEERAAIARVAASDRWTMTAGNECRAFEREFAEHHGRKHGIMCNSGSSANLIATASLFHKTNMPLERGNLALVPAIAWSTTFAPLIQHGLDLKLADVERASWNSPPCNPGLNARLLVTCSVLGNPVNYWGWLDKTRDWDGYWIDDCCEAVGASVGPLGKRRLVGSFATLSTFSFFHSHQLSAIEGGMILTDDDELADLCRMLRAHGWTRDVKAPETLDDEYDFRLMGYNVRPLELHAAIARAQLPKLEDFRKARQQNWNNFYNLVEGYRIPVTMQAMGGFPNAFGMAFTVESKEKRAELVAALRANGVDCRLPTGGSFRKHRYGSPWADQETPNADAVHDRGLFLGNAPYAIDAQIARAIEVMRNIL